MARSYKIYKAYHTSHHNTTKTHLQISTPPSNVQQRIDIHNFPPNHMESQTSKPQASSNAPTLTTSPANHKETQPFLHAVQRSADGSSNSLKSTQPHTINQAPEQPPYPSRPEKPAREASLSRTPLSQKKNRPAHTPTRSQKPESQDSINQKHSL